MFSTIINIYYSIVSNAGVKWGGGDNNDMWVDKEDITSINKNKSDRKISSSSKHSKIDSTSSNIMNWISKQDSYVEEF
jgi:hypothetical protein